MSYSKCIESLNEAKDELGNEKQFTTDEIVDLSRMIQRCIEAIEDQWGK
ncbi:hypothetical protein [Flavobacterium alkalisoli]